MQADPYLTDPSPIRGMCSDHEWDLKVWFERWDRAMNNPMSAEIVPLLDWAFKTREWREDQAPQPLTDRRFRLFLALIAGRSVVNKPGMGLTFWESRRNIEDKAIAVMTEEHLGVPYEYEYIGRNWDLPMDRYDEQARKTWKVFGKIHAEGRLGDLLQACLDPESLRLILFMYSPRKRPLARWWLPITRLPERERAHAYFFQWLLRQLWWTGSLKRGEAASLRNARRLTFDWMTEKRYVEPLRGTNVIASDVHVLLWARRRGKPIQRTPLRIPAPPGLQRIKRRPARIRYA